MNPVIIIAGATASGKTSVAVELAKLINAEIISADSRQVYRYLDIGTAKPTNAEREGIRHHGFDIVDPDEHYSAGKFANDAREWIKEISSRGKNVIIAGGSGLYLKALIDGFFGDDIKDPDIRSKLEKRSEKDGLAALHEELKSLDPVCADKTMPNDRHRILRALEVIHASGIPFSEVHKRKGNPSQFSSIWFGLKWDRKELYKRIDRRVEEMFDNGLIEEVKSLLDRGWRNKNALKSPGYEEIIPFLDSADMNPETTKSIIKQNTRHFAKRQLTWFGRNERITWLMANNSTPDAIAKQILTYIINVSNAGFKQYTFR
ncbi:MAG: tRNA (adenosine(37)-N6)-dimethylallyltransferase MiaA [Candidatus Electryonea clarkiae]|nr:tRNA (adenosine(37)-N6)-dimethylallyltransferase MiaA [Candidatus Electryonea clarkiae]MDP8286509.1 tRNA (adenosine(37)-N6)-dimethylallyltransferase MiaA [Candidatus Electryonea clarkiae]